jgi:hypothetical protein
MSEHDSQCALFQWAKLMEPQYPELAWYFAVPNGTRTTMAIARKIKEEGVKRGVPDTCLPIARGGYHSLYIEMKSPGEYPRPEQREWLSALKDQGHYTACCHSWEEAAALITKYLEGEL